MKVPVPAASWLAELAAWKDLERNGCEPRGCMHYSPASSPISSPRPNTPRSTSTRASTGAAGSDHEAMTLTPAKLMQDLPAKVPLPVTARMQRLGSPSLEPPPGLSHPLEPSSSLRLPLEPPPVLDGPFGHGSMPLHFRRDFEQGFFAGLAAASGRGVTLSIRHPDRQTPLPAAVAAPEMLLRAATARSATAPVPIAPEDARAHPARPGGLTCTSSVGGGSDVCWVVEGRKLDSRDKVVVSPAFNLDLPGLGPTPFKLAIYPRVARGGRCGGDFRRTGGWGHVELKCVAQLPQGAARVVFSIGVGSNAPRGPVQHDFSEQSWAPQGRGGVALRGRRRSVWHLRRPLGGHAPRCRILTALRDRLTSAPTFVGRLARLQRSLVGNPPWHAPRVRAPGSHVQNHRRGHRNLPAGGFTCDSSLPCDGPR